MQSAFADVINYLAVIEATLDVPWCVDPRYRPCQAVVASVGSVVLYFTLYVEPLTIPVAVSSASLLLQDPSKL